MDQQRILADVAASAGDSVVAVGPGSGFVISAGRVLTNAHNLRSRDPAVRFGDGREAEATLLGADLDGDLAVLDVDTGEVPALEWSPDEATLGATVIGIAPTRSGPRVTIGHVSAVGQAFRGPRGRPVMGAIEHTAPLARGSSGSPILDEVGRVLGVNTHRRGHGFYLAVAADGSLQATIDSLGRGESRQRPRLGIAVAPPHVAARLRSAVGLDDREGLLVREVAEDSPAARAGLRRGDLVVAAGGETITTVDGLFGALDAAAADALELRVLRGTEEHTVVVDLTGGRRSEGSV